MTLAFHNREVSPTILRRTVDALLQCQTPALVPCSSHHVPPSQAPSEFPKIKTLLLRLLLLLSLPLQGRTAANFGEIETPTPVDSFTLVRGWIRLQPGFTRSTRLLEIAHIGEDAYALESFPQPHLVGQDACGAAARPARQASVDRISATTRTGRFGGRDSHHTRVEIRGHHGRKEGASLQEVRKRRTDTDSRHSASRARGGHRAQHQICQRQPLRFRKTLFVAGGVMFSQSPPRAPSFTP